MATLDDLTAEKTEAEFQTEILADLADSAVTGVTGGLPTTSWQSGSVPRIFVAAWARLARSFNDLIRAVASGVLLELSTGAWLTLLARNVYEVDRDVARSTVGLVQLTDASGSPGTYAVGALTISDSAGRYYQNTLAGTVSANASVFLQFTAMAAGADGNVGNGSLSTLVTAAAGRTVNNPIPWITVFGSAGASTRGYVMLTSTGGGAILAGGVTVTNGTWNFTNVSADTLVAGVAKAVLFESTLAGAQGNVGNGEIDTVSVDPLGDITCVNSAPSTGTWITSSGSDEQSDTLLRAECAAKWSTLGVGWTADAIEYLTLQAETSATITRVKVETNPGGVSGRVGVTVASAAGAVSGADVAVVQAYLDANRSLTSEIVVASATLLTVTITGVVYVPLAYVAAAQAAATRNLIALEGAVPIGGDDDAANAVQLEDILSAIKAASYDADGVNTNPASPLRIQLTAPTGDTSLSAYQVPDLDYSGLTFTGV